MTTQVAIGQSPKAPTIDLFPPSDFDEWAATYDQDVLRSVFPFDGYSDVLGTTLRLAEVRPGQTVLDLGVGTGNLSILFSQQGCQIFGIDYSARMLEYAQRKLPQAKFVQADLRQPWPATLEGPFDRIVSAYVFHHFELAQKISLLTYFDTLLSPGGLILIADLAFSTLLALQAMRQVIGSAWEDEYYWVADEALPALAQAGMFASFKPISSCAGVYVIPKS